MFGSEASAQAAIENDDPEKQSDGKQDLPKAAEIEVFKSLIADPDIADKPLDSCELTQEASHDYDDKGTQQSVSEQLLSARLAAGNHRCEKDAGCQIGGRDPEDGELQMPGANYIEGQDATEVNAEEGLQIGAVVFGGATEQRLHDEQGCHDEEEPGAHFLRGSEQHLVRCAEGHALRLTSMPSQEIPSTKCGEEEPGPTQQRSE